MEQPQRAFNASAAAIEAAQYDMSPEILDIKIKEVQKQIKKLKESNELLREEDPEKNDAEIQEAIVENEGTIARQESMIEDMCRLFEERFPHISSSRVHNHDHDHDHEQEVSEQQQLEEEEESSYGPPGLTME